MNKLIAMMVILGACVELEESSVEQNGTSANGVSANGTSLNGTSVNGTSLNGTSVNGTSVNGTSVNGTSIGAISTNAPPLSGAGPVGSKWTATLSNDATVKLRIDSAEQGTGTNSDLWFYGVSYQTSTGWSPLCVDATGAAVRALPVAGVWGWSETYEPSTTKFTWACRSKTVAKCVELGYKPYKGYPNTLASCVRMLRADYCGSGYTHTADGQLLNLYDRGGVQLDTQPWAIEAEWAPDGATCVKNASATRFARLSLASPLCLASLILPTCGTFRPGTYLIDELPPVIVGK